MKTYEMTAQQHERLMAACQPVPYLVIGGIAPESPQEKANRFWRELGAELGFDWQTARPVQGQRSTFFEAEELQP